MRNGAEMNNVGLPLPSHYACGGSVLKCLLNSILFFNRVQ